MYEPALPQILTNFINDASRILDAYYSLRSAHTPEVRFELSRYLDVLDQTLIKGPCETSTSVLIRNAIVDAVLTRMREMLKIVDDEDKVDQAPA
jgi:hypothetical protein